MLFVCIASPLRCKKNALTSESYPLSEMSRNLVRMKAVPDNAAFCKQLITMGVPTVFRWFSSSSLNVPKAPTTIGITAALTSHNFCACNLKSWYLVVFSSSFTLMFWSPGTPMSMILHSLFSLSMTTIPDLWCSISLSAWIAKSRNILHLSFSSTGSGWFENHLFSHSTLNFFHISQCNFFPSLSCLFLYWFAARTEHELTIWVTRSTFSLQSLHSGDTSWWSMLFVNAFVLSACSWAAHIRLSVSRSGLPAFSHCHLLWSCIPSLFPLGIHHTMFSLSILIVFDALVLLYSSNQSLFLVVTLQLQSLEISRFCLQHNQKG